VPEERARAEIFVEDPPGAAVQVNQSQAGAVNAFGGPPDITGQLPIGAAFGGRLVGDRPGPNAF
jgi:hypothetical protein